MVGTSDVQICNIALRFVGVEPIVSLSDNSKSAKLCNLFYAFDRDAVIQDHSWSFAVTRQALSQLSGTNTTEYAYMYSLPASPYCLRPLGIVDYPAQPFLVEERVLYTDLEAVTLRYISQVTDPTVFDPAFIRALSYRLAADICESIEGRSPKAVQFGSMYERALNTAKGLDAAGRMTPRQPSKLWTDARFE